MSSHSEDVVVVLEDDEADRRFMERSLEDVGVGVRLVFGRTVDEIGPLVEEHDPAMVVCDLMVPGGRALELIRSMSTARPDRPIVVFTTSTASWDHHAAIAAGARAVHVKPFEWAEYRTLIKDMLGYWLRH